MTENKKVRILGIETSCDETAISIVEADETSLHILSNLVISQIDIHKPYGGVFPMLAKREHAKNLVPMLDKALIESKLKIEKEIVVSMDKTEELKKIFEREPELLAAFLDLIPAIQTPDIDYIAFTQGPGLPPALWVGLNFARALSLVWEKPLVPMNHMEGHYFSALLGKKEPSVLNMQFPRTPVLALLISGGHTQIMLSKELLSYEMVGETRDDAAGEAFDKAARILGLPYPGGPEISSRAEKFRKSGKEATGKYKLPRPMIYSGDFDFSFSGIKTAVLYMVQKITDMNENIREEICYEFEEAVTETLLSKMLAAAEKYNPETIIMGGGVSANSYIQNSFKDTFAGTYPDTKIFIPEKELTGDNAIMIAAAGYMRILNDPERILDLDSTKIAELRADGNLKL